MTRRFGRRFTHTSLAFLIFRFRYLVAFTLFGLISIVAEVLLVQYAMPASWPLLPKAVLAFEVGLVISFLLNARFNFRVPKKYLRRTFVRFALVSLASFLLNLAAMRLFQETFGWSYGPSRFVSSAALFLLGYTVHRRLTFESVRNFGIAVYACKSERVGRIFHKVGRACDHIHVDLVDRTMNPHADEVDLSRIETARRLWPGVPFALHIMSRFPSRWTEATANSIDWYLFHLGAQEDLFTLIAWCHKRGKKAGIVWHQSDSVESLYAYLPHVDFVMTLGIAQPGLSGQPISEAALEVTDMLERLRSKYGYELMFDGSVNSQTVERIRARYLVAASAVLKASNPVQAIYSLKRGTQDERWAA